MCVIRFIPAIPRRLVGFRRGQVSDLEKIGDAVTHRDPELLRIILLMIDANPKLNGYALWRVPLYQLDVDENTILYNARQLVQASLIDGQMTGSGELLVRGLTPSGHDFLEAARNEGVWTKVKSVVAEKGGGATLDILKALLIDAAKAQFGLK
jgi:DNA-binding PadR family transcriptional regulator